MSNKRNSNNIPLGIMFLMLFYHLNVNIWFIRYVWLVISYTFFRNAIKSYKGDNDEN